MTAVLERAWDAAVPTLDDLDDEQLYSSVIACDMSGLTYRELDHWCRRGAIAPEVEAMQSGSRRGWTRHQIAALIELARVREQLQAAGCQMSLDAVGQAWDRLIAGEAWGIVAIATPPAMVPVA